ncbi:nuclear transport factor 2 family protein (plasmid) [Pseudoalteromonas sp. T1lg65]|uniref:nuclear transport factor 2 family protein n=1 Tax=Pseudoalteromonas sp. T1lg65 TaxID=2077101 RepID=UPI003F79150A
MTITEQHKTDIEQQVTTAFQGLVAASKTLNSAQYFEFIDQEKFVGLNADGSNWNSASELKALIDPSFSALEKVESLTFTNVKVSVIDENTAILVNEYQQTVILKDGSPFTAEGGGMQVWSKSSGKWLLVGIGASAKR